MKFFIENASVMVLNMYVNIISVFNNSQTTYISEIITILSQLTIAPLPGFPTVTDLAGLQ